MINEILGALLFLVMGGIAFMFGYSEGQLKGREYQNKIMKPYLDSLRDSMNFYKDRFFHLLEIIKDNENIQSNIPGRW